MDLLSALLLKSDRDYPIVTLKPYKEDADLWQLYADCFGQPKVNKLLQDYWMEKLGITEGAAKSIFTEINKMSEQAIPTIIAGAFEKENNTTEKELLRWILDLEPFLTRCTHAFYLLADVSTKKTLDAKRNLDMLVSNMPLKSVLPLAGKNDRLKMLLDVVKDHTADGIQFGEAILRYHKKIMEDRGGVAWVELENEELKHYIPQTVSVTTENIVSGNYWYNRYYLDAVKSIYNGLN
jgi:hypothetical protein